jgi:uncharacterized protein YndB with AHSA1/START domain
MSSNVIAHASITIKAPVGKVWEALTTPELIKKYFFGTEAISDWKKGSPIVFKGEWEGKSYSDRGTILEVVPNKLFAYTYWSSMSGLEDKPENYVTITYELTEVAPLETRLDIRQENIPDEKMREHSEENWNKVLKGLKEVCEK